MMDKFTTALVLLFFGLTLSDTGYESGAYASSLHSGTRAVENGEWECAANGITQAGVSAVTLGLYESQGLFTLTATDLAYGAGYTQSVAYIGGSIAIGVASGGAGCAGTMAGNALRMYNIASNGVTMARAGADMYSNGLTLSNSTQMLAGGLGFAGNLSQSCFTEGTQIVVGAIYDENDVFVQYVTVNIEDIKVGDFVYSYDTITGTVEQKEVTAVFVRESDHINYLTIVDEHNNVQVIETTDSHPFWVVTDEPDLSRAARSVVDENGVWLYHENIGPTENGFWVEAKDLRAGDVFLGANGELTTFIDIERVVFPDGIKVYNFTVDGNHNYFVIAKCDEYGQTCVLVHNACFFPPGQIQKKYKHAPDFGVTGNWNKQSGEAFQQAILDHINKPGIQKIQGTYRGDPVTHYFEKSTQLNVMVCPNNNFISGWKLTEPQMMQFPHIGGGR